MTLLDARRGRFRYSAKILLAIALVAGFDRLFLFHESPGWTIGAFALAWLAATVTAHPEIRRDRRALFAACAAVVFAFGLVEQPGFLGWELFTTSLALAVLLPRVGRFGDAVGWAIRLTWMGLAGVAGPLLDARRMQRLRKKIKSRPVLKRLTIFILPVVGAVVFISLFANANPVLANLLADIRWPTFDLETAVRLAILAFVSAVVWATLRPRRLRSKRLPDVSTIKGTLTVSEVSVVLSLVVFNLIFTVENGLDIAFLWSDAPLPAGVTLAQYAHRGAYPLIATALLAGLFVLVFLRPGSPTAKRPLIRWLVIAWIFQNVFLVASSILRTLDYIDAYSLTQLRIAALLWMGLVGAGLVLVCWRLFREKTSAWLINVNAAAALIVLAGVSFTDLGAVAASWNVRHASEIDGTGAALDLKYLSRLGPSALVPLIELETRPLQPALLGNVVYLRGQALDALVDRQDDWRSWTWRGQRRLDAANAALARNAPAPTSPTPPVLTYPAAP